MPPEYQLCRPRLISFSSWIGTCTDGIDCDAEVYTFERCQSPPPRWYLLGQDWGGLLEQGLIRQFLKFTFLSPPTP